MTRLDRTMYTLRVVVENDEEDQPMIPALFVQETIDKALRDRYAREGYVKTTYPIADFDTTGGE